MFAEVVNYGCALGDHDSLVRSCRSDANSRRSPKWMYLLQVGPCTEFRVTLVDFDFIVELELFEQPYDSLSPRFLEPVACLVEYRKSSMAGLSRIRVLGCGEGTIGVLVVMPKSGCAVVAYQWTTIFAPC